jgi:hypothetical protein
MKIKLFAISTLLILISSLFGIPKVSALVKCECVAYVKNYFGISEQIGNAKVTGEWFLAHGFTRINKPVVGAVAVMQPTFGKAPAAGHVGIIESVTSPNSNQWKIKIRGANQTLGTPFSEFGCNNVKITSYTAYSKTDPKIKYYLPKNIYLKSNIPALDSSSLYLGIQSNSASSGAYMIGQPSSSGNNYQKFTLVQYGNRFTIISRKSAMCVVPRSTNVNSKLVQKPCNGSAIQKWAVYDDLTIVNGKKIKNSSTGYYATMSQDTVTPTFWWITNSPPTGTAAYVWFFETNQ